MFYLFFVVLFRDKASVAASFSDIKDRIVTGLTPIGDEMTPIHPDLALFVVVQNMVLLNVASVVTLKKNWAKWWHDYHVKKTIITIKDTIILVQNLHCPKVLKNMLLFAADKCDNEKTLFDQFVLFASANFVSIWIGDMWCDMS